MISVVITNFLEMGEKIIDLNQPLQDSHRSLDFVLPTGRERPIINLLPYTD